MLNRGSPRRSAWLAVAMAVAAAAEDVAVERAGRVSLSVDSPSVVEGGTAAWTVTASAEARGVSEDGKVLEVRVVSAGGWAEPSYDYERVDQVVGFRRSDFARAGRSAGRRGVFAGRHNPVDLATGRGWIATKSGTFGIIRDGEVEQSETFLLTMSIAEGVGWVSDAEEGVEVRIRDADAWGLALTASPRAVDEGETGELALTARVLRGDGTVPPPRTCVVPFPFRVRLAVGGTALPGDDYAVSGLPDGWRVAACNPEVSWTVRLAAQGGDEDDADETVRFTPVVDGLPEGGRMAPAFVVPARVTIRERP